MRLYLGVCPSPLGILYLVSDESSLLSISFSYPENGDEFILADTAAIKAARQWLKRYFRGENPPLSSVPFRLEGTSFEKDVWEILLTIDYGKTTTYGEIASLIAQKREISRMSAQAVGGAVGRNRLPVLIPCHRVLGKGGRLTGYTGGIEKKIILLEIEKVVWRW